MDVPELAKRCDLEVTHGRATVLHWLRIGLLHEIWPGVLISHARQLDPCLRAGAALLYGGADAVLSNRTALWLHGCPAAAGHSVHVTIPYGGGRRAYPGLVLHRGRCAKSDVVEIGGMRVQAVAAAVTEVLCTERRRTALAVADQAAALCADPEFHAEIEGKLVERRDRRGTVRAAELLHLVTGLAESAPESWLRLDLFDAGFPPPTPQFTIYDLAGAVRYILDFAWPDLKIALEYDGYEAHEHREASDRARDADLERRGWIVIRIEAADLENPTRWVRELLDAFRRRGVSGLDITMPHRSQR